MLLTHSPRVVLRRAAVASVLCVGAAAGLVGCLPTPGEESPRLIAHRGGAADGPENTLPAIERAVDRGADLIWVSVQVSADGVPVLYRPRDLSALTDASGPVSSKTVDELSALDAGAQFEDTGGERPYAGIGVGVPTLDAALAAIPVETPVVVDVKTAEVEPMVPALFRLIDELDAWERVVFYSTQTDVHDALAAEPRATVFESRDDTRRRLLEVRLAGECTPPASNAWVGYELYREVAVTEEFTLGEGETDLTAQMWTADAVECVRRAPGTTIVFFGLEDRDAAGAVADLAPDALLVDSLRGAAGDGDGDGAELDRQDGRGRR